MIAAVTLNGSMGFALLIAMLFCMGPVDQILGSEFFFPFVLVFQSATNSVGGATAMVIDFNTGSACHAYDHSLPSFLSLE